MAMWLEDGFSWILELRFQKVTTRISLSNCWTLTSFVFLDFLFVLHNSTPSTHLRAVFYNIPHRRMELFLRGLIGYLGIHSRTCIKRSVVKFAIFFPLMHFHFHHFSAVVSIKRLWLSLTESHQPVRVVWNGHLGGITRIKRRILSEVKFIPYLSPKTNVSI